MKKSAVILFILIIGFVINVEAQRKRKFRPGQRFNAGITAGVNFSQMDGDYYVGYDKFGIQMGVRGIAKLSPKFDLAIEMLFSQRGSRDPDERVPGGNARQITLNYVDIPILVHYHYQKENKLNISFDVGVAFGRLLNYKINEIPNSSLYVPFATVEEEFNRNEWMFVLGAGVYFSDRLRFFVRHNTGLNFLYQSEDEKVSVPSSSIWQVTTNQNEIKRLRNYQFSLNCNYMF